MTLNGSPLYTSTCSSNTHAEAEKIPYKLCKSNLLLVKFLFVVLDFLKKISPEFLHWWSASTPAVLSLVSSHTDLRIFTDSLKSGSLLFVFINI